MKRFAPLSILLSIAILLTTSPAAAQTGPGQQQRAPLGSGARFLPPTTAAYVGIDLVSDQWAHVHRLAGYYLRAGDLFGPQRQVGRQTGMSASEVLEGIRSWAGGESFVAVPDIAELGRLQSFGDEESGLCDGPGVLVGAAIGDVSAFLSFVRRVDAQIGAAPTLPDAPGGPEIYEVGRSAA